MKTFDKVIAKKLRDEIDTALKSLGEKYDITIRAGSCSFSETEMKYRLEVKTNDKEAIQAKKQKAWDTYHKLLGFEKGDLGKTFVSSGETWTIIGIDLGRSKYDLEARNSKGKVLLFVSGQIAKKLHPEPSLTETLKNIATPQEVV